MERERLVAEREAFDREWPLHGVCTHYLAHVHARPDGASRITGTMRRGSTFRAKARVAGPGCERGWYEVVGGGFVCRGRGYQLGSQPQEFADAPVAPSLASALPYPYARVNAPEAPQFWRFPTVDEEGAARELVSRMREARERAAAEAVEEPDPGLEAPPQDQAEVGASSTVPGFFRMRMERGFTVSVDQAERDGARVYFRTVRGAYVPADAMAEVTPPSMRGVVLGGIWRFPLGFVVRRGATWFERDPRTGAFGASSTPDWHAPLLLQPEGVERAGALYALTRQGRAIRTSAVRQVLSIARPRTIAVTDRWVHVDVGDQTLVAYEGDRPVFATLVSSGREGFATPTGTFRIQSKHVTATMDDPEGSEPYSIEDVPWTMYFDGSYALHAAFWHDQFGRPRSHGCVNLAPADARWLFQWTTPALPAGWHGVVADSSRPGTWVHITE